MKKILGFICAALTATIGFADTTETDGTNTDGATGTETQAETTETITAIGVNFCSTKGADTTKALFVSAWTNNTAYSNSSTVSGTIGLFDGSTKLSFSCKNTWTHTKNGKEGTDSESSSFLNGYLDDGTNNQHTSGIEISCTNIPFDFYDVVIYYASDGDTSQFTAPTVNGARWTADTSCPSVAKKGSDNWGSSAFNNGACTYGANVLRLVGLSGDLSIASSGDYKTGYRGSIAAIQIVKSNHGIFGFDFNSRAKQSTNGTATFAASTVGELIPCANWVHCFDAPNSSTNFVSKTSSVSATWSCANVYSTDSNRDSATDATFIHGYLDDGTGISIACTNIPFAKYDVVIYMATDASNKKFTAPTVNEKQYTYDSANPAKAKDGSDAFGDSNVHDYCAYGTNVLRVRDLEGNLTIKSTAGTDARGCIAAIQILASPETMTVGGADKTTKNWSETSIWQDNTAATNDLVEVDLQGDATVTLDTDLNLDQLTVRNAHTLTLKNADPAKAVSIDFIGLKDGATLAIADEALTNVINNAAFYSALINDYKTPSTLISRTYGNVYTQGAGESGSSKTINAQGGSITLSGAGKTYYVNGGVSETKTTVVFDGATIEYGNNQLGVGQADYILSNATVKANSFVLSQGNDGRTATFTMNGSSSMTVTGTTNEDTNQSSIMFGHWKGPSTFTMNGTSTFTASNAQVLVGKTGYNQTINVNGGTLTAKGIKLAGNASGTNKLNLNGGTLALGEVGITSYSTSRTMAIAVGGDAAIEATAATLPISQAMTIADGKTLTIKKATGNTNENVALTLSGAISGTGTVKIEEGITTVDFGTTRTTTPFEVSANTVFKAKPTDDDEILTFTLKGFTTAANFKLYKADGTEITDVQVKINGDLVSVTATPMFTVSTAEADLSTAANWSGSEFVKTGAIIINNTSGAETTITVPEACTYTMVYVRGKVRFKFSENATLSTTGCSIQFHDANAALAIDGGTTEAEYKNTITGDGKVDVYGTVKMTKISSFTGGITVKPGASLSTSCSCGFGAQSGTMTIEGGATVDFSNAGTLAGLVLKPTNTSTIGLTNITSLTRSSVVLDLSTLDRTNMTYGSTFKIVTGTAGTITSSLMTQVSGDDWYSLSYNEAGSELVVSKLADPKKKFMHYDFNSQSSGAAQNLASDSESYITSFNDGNGATLTLSKRGKTGTSAKIVSGSTPYYSGISAGKQFLYSKALSVTTVARVMCAPTSGNKVILWGIGSMQPQVDSGATSLFLVAVDTNTVALVEGTSTARVVQEICRVTGIKNLTTEFHFFAIVIDGALATLYVDKLAPQTGTNIATDLGQCGQFGSTFRGLPNDGYQTVGSTGYYLDDWAVYDLALTADEVNALRKKYCPTPFMITAE